MEKGTNTDQEYALAVDAPNNNNPTTTTTTTATSELTSPADFSKPNVQQPQDSTTATTNVPTMEMYLLPPKKQGHKCCGGCCDMRRATMIVNFINIGFILLGLWYICAVVALRKSASQQAVDDDEMQEMYSEMEEIKGLGAIAAIMVVRLVCNSCGVYGAYTFNQYLVGASLAAYALETIFAFLSFNLGGLLMAAFFAYPHVFLIRELRAGIMCPENYPVEEQSCCCV